MANKSCMKVVIGGVLHLILLELDFNLDYFTHMHVQGVFAKEEFGCPTVPSSNLKKYNNGEKKQIVVLHIYSRSLLEPLFVCFFWHFE